MLARAMYVCRLYRPEHHGTARKCVDCGRTVTVHPGVHSDRVRRSRELGYDLDIVCDGCAGAFGFTVVDGQPLVTLDVHDRDLVVVMPTREEILAANTAGNQ